jgi:long-chain acyl-CoA synthetase
MHMNRDNLYDRFAETARTCPDQPAVLGPQPDACLTYRQLHDAICRIDLACAGVRPGDCVGLHIPSGIQYVTLAYAIWRAGGCVVPIPMELTEPEKHEIVCRIGMTHVISEPNGLTVTDARTICNATLIAKCSEPRRHPDGFEHINAAFVRFTSGTTGAAKGVVLSHATIRERIEAANDVLHIGPADRVVWLLSMSYHFTVTVVAYLSFGAAIVLPANNFGQSVLHAAQRHDATIIYASPLHYAWLASVPGNARLPASMRLALSTTTALDRNTAERFQQRFGLPVTQALGIIEIGLPFINLRWASTRPKAIGELLPAYQLRLHDVGLGENVGEIQIAGPGMLDAYYDPWQPRSLIAPNGWFRTGDIGERDADGCVTLRGRAKDVINVGGMKLFPQEVEAVLRSHPAVADVCVRAETDSRLGEVPVARVVLQSDATCTPLELRDHCAQRLADWKIPQRIEWTESLARTASGKPLRRDP